MKADIKYEEAVSQLEAIVRQLEHGELDIDQMGKQLKKAQQLITLCRAKLTKTEAEINAILNENTDKK